MNELIKVEEGQLIIAQKSIEKIKALEEKKKEIDAIQKEYKDKIQKIMEENNIKKFESNDKTLQITYVEPTTAFTFDSKLFQKEHFNLYTEYLRETPKKGSIRLTIRDKEEK